MYTSWHYFFSSMIFLQTLLIYRTAGESRGPSLLPSTFFPRLRTFRHLIVTLHMSWLLHMLMALFVITRLLLDVIYHLIELSFAWLMMKCEFPFCFLNDFLLDFSLQQFDKENRWIALTVTLTVKENRPTKYVYIIITWNLFFFQPTVFKTRFCEKKRQQKFWRNVSYPWIPRKFRRRQYENKIYNKVTKH